MGVLLSELLAGGPPFTRRGLPAGVLELLRLIREQEPTKPSAKLSTAEGLPALASSRGTEPARLTKLVRGELDWIVLKALEKDRSRRYETATAFAADVQRHLADEPVLACPPSAAYRLRKLVRRNKGPVLAACLVCLAVLAGTAVSVWQAARADQQRRLAEANERKAVAAAEAEAEANRAAQAREAEARAVLEFVEQRVIAAARPEGQDGGLGRDVTLRKALEAALAFLD